LYDFIPGQRCISNAELEMGLGTVMAVDDRTVTLVFIATGETRTYSRLTAPLSRVVFTVGDTIKRHDGTEIVVTALHEEQGLVAYSGTDVNGNNVELPESELDNFIQLNRPLSACLTTRLIRINGLNCAIRPCSIRIVLLILTYLASPVAVPA